MSAGPWGQSGDGHLRITKTDDDNVGRGFERRLHVSPALPSGLHIDVAIWGINGNEDQHHAGINLTRAEAVKLIEHVAKVLAHGAVYDVAAGECLRVKP